MADDLTIIDVFERVLGVPFRPQWTAEISIDVSTTRHLAEEIAVFYKGFRFPEKDSGEMRPYLFHSYEKGNQPWQNFVRFEGSNYTFAPSSATDLFNFLKPFLLYSHGVCFLDPLPGLLDYFRPSPDISDYEKARLPGVSHLLSEYVKIADLIRHQIVVPISYEVFGPYSRGDFGLSMGEKSEITALIAGALHQEKQAEESSFALHVGSLIKEQMWLNQCAQNRVDLYFPNASCVPVLQGLLQAASHRYSSKEIYEPYAVGVLADIATIDTSRILISDIIAIRSEGAFNDYRKVLQRILRRLRDREGEFSDLESEFAVAAREEMAECGDKINQITKKSSLLRDTLRNSDRILIGGACGYVGGILSESSVNAILYAAVGAAVPPFYDIVRGAWSDSPNSAARSSLRSHFLVLDPKSSQSAR